MSDGPSSPRQFRKSRTNKEKKKHEKWNFEKLTEQIDHKVSDYENIDVTRVANKLRESN